MHSLAYGNAMMAAVRDYKQVPWHDTSNHSPDKALRDYYAQNSHLSSYTSLVQLFDCLYLTSSKHLGDVGHGASGVSQQAASASQRH